MLLALATFWYITSQTRETSLSFDGDMRNSRISSTEARSRPIRTLSLAHSSHMWPRPQISSLQ